MKIDLLLEKYFFRYIRGEMHDGEECLDKAMEVVFNNLGATYETSMH